MEGSAWKWLTQLYVGTGNGQGCGAREVAAGYRGQVRREMSAILINIIVTVFAKRRSRLVEDHRFAFHFMGQFMTVQAGHVTMSAIERIPGPLIMVELRWFPAHSIMATRAVGCFRPGGKLLRVHVLVAPGAQLWRGCEIHVLQGHLHGGRAMTVNARGRAMRAGQREFRRRMIETRQFAPFHCRVTRLAACDRAVRQLDLHLRLEFAFVYVLVADSAGHIIKMILHRSNRALRYGLVTVHTGDSNVSAGQRETCLLVFGQGEQRRTPTLIFYVVASIALV
jgi:hypothetical protein